LILKTDFRQPYKHCNFWALKSLQDGAYEMAKKKPEPVFQVHHQELQCNDAFCCLFEACHDSGQAVSALAYAKATFNSVALSHILTRDFRCLFVIEWTTTQWRPAQPDAMFPAEREVLTVTI
jgi:hypothetical protein